MKTPKITVLMSVFNGAPFVAQAMDGILSQTFDDFEFLIIEDASTDKTADILADYAEKDDRILVLYNKTNLGLTRSLNRGLKQARGIYIARQDADDISHKERLQRQVQLLDQQSEVGLVGSACLLINASNENQGVAKTPCSHEEIFWNSLFLNPLFHGSVLFRKEMDGRKIFYDEEIPFSQDYALWVQLLNKSRAKNLPEPLISLRKHQNRTSVTRIDRQRELSLQISIQHIENFMPGTGLNLKEMKRLRFCFQFISQEFYATDLDYYALLLKLFQKFEQNKDFQKSVLNSIRKSVVYHILDAVPANKWPEAWRHGLFRKVVRYRPFVMVPYVLDRLKRRWGVRKS